MQEQIRAIWRDKYGSPDALYMKNVDKPIPKEDEVLVKVHAVSLNSSDLRLLKADPWMIRLVFGFSSPSLKILGSDVAGVVEAVGPKVKDLKVGDQIWGDISSANMGSLSEYVCKPEKLFSLKPSNLDFKQAACIPEACVTALQALRDHGKVKKGDKVLINGATSGVGSFAVQIAKHYGAYVVAVGQSSKADMIKELGADSVICYDKEDVTKLTEKFDVILDMACYDSVKRLLPLLQKTGTYVVGGGGMYPLVQCAWTKNCVQFTASNSRKELDEMKSLAESFAIKPYVDKVFKFEDTVEAFKYLEDRKVKGKIVIEIAQ
ncbi:hypothetical protein MIR68_001682 [Amoeboaphelidium protococcarum]|nr:hypothetical protein MIR68_001682 [Amoeboaphelidium protococcarum]